MLQCHSTALNHFENIKNNTLDLVKLGSITETKLSDFLSRTLNNSSTKGDLAENMLVDSLCQALPTHEITKNSDKKAQRGRMDIIISKSDKPKILIDSKNHKTNVSGDEVEKFKRDILRGNNHGILVSCNSGIRDKKNFQIDFFDNDCIGMYICNNGTTANEIVKAINIIYAIHPKISEFKNKSLQLTPEQLQVLNDIKTNMNDKIKSIKSHASLIIDDCQEIVINRFKEILDSINKN